MSDIDRRVAREAVLEQYRRNPEILDLQIAAAGGRMSAGLKLINDQSYTLSQIALLEQALAALPESAPSPPPGVAAPTPIPSVAAPQPDATFQPNIAPASARRDSVYGQPCKPLQVIMRFGVQGKRTTIAWQCDSLQSGLQPSNCRKR